MPFEGGAGEDVPVELGSKSLIPGFEEQLVGVKVGETRTIKAPFPDNYVKADLAGKAAEFEVTGPDRNAFVQRVTCNDVGALRPGQAQYSAILTEQGTFVDDCLVYRFEDRLMMVVNAANIARDWEHVVQQKRGANVRLRDISDDTGLLAVQGPGAEAHEGAGQFDRRARRPEGTQ